ncbi:MAG: hypothetical protein K9W44_01485 [Candidatus Lokiarchaeota archaeon]|nr:hypothetical protein [Candidatus Harpocratesius repetitus]
MACMVETKSQKILIDPGLALDQGRKKLLPHPFQIEISYILRSRIINEMQNASDIIITHFHGDHHPMVEADLVQLSASTVIEPLKSAKLWVKSPENTSKTSRYRRKKLQNMLGCDFINPEGKSFNNLQFSESVPHGYAQKSSSFLNSVMMVRIVDDNDVFVFGSDIQLLDSHTIDIILDWKPTILYVAGPPLYLYQVKKSRQKLEEIAWKNALKLADFIPEIIIDHHVIRSQYGIDFVDRLNKVSEMSKSHIMTAADYMGYQRAPLEALRNELYRDLPVPQKWHDDFLKHGRLPIHFKKWRCFSLEHYPLSYQLSSE